MTELGPLQPTPFGKYLLLERIGAGGMAEIFRAKTFGAAGFEKEYAIKRILPNLSADEEFVSMFVNEAKLMVDLYHANIVQVFDLGELDATYYIAMEFVYGKDLLDLLARCAENDLKIPLKLTLFMLLEVLKGLDFAHKALDRFGEPLNIIHRDVSPSNIMLSYAGDVKIGDFGVAKAKTQTQMTEAGTLKGKVGYMSPEQVRGDDIDHRSDVFAAGIILYESLTMTRLFMGGSDLDVMLKVRDADIEDELRRCRKVPATLVNILRRALSKDPERRYLDCAAFYRALEDFIYTQNIKTGSRDLASFLHRVFRDEIKAEKSRRLHDPRELAGFQTHEERPRTARQQWEGSQTDGAIPSLRDSSLSALKDRPNDSRGWVKRLTGEMGYRYRDAAGRIYGPMALQELRALLSTQPESDREAVAFGERGWLSPDDMPELWEVERQVSALGSRSGLNSLSDVPGLQPTHQGHLGRVTLARLLFRLARRRQGGMLRVESPVHHKELFLRRGDPVLVTSSMSEELLGTYLLRRKIINDDQLERALARLQEFGGRLGDALVGERILPTHDLFRFLAEQLQDRILNIFTWAEAEWSWFPNSRPPHQAVPLGVNLVDLILDGIRNYLDAQSIAEHFSGRESDSLAVVHSRVALDDLPLLPNELEVASLVTPGMTPSELLEAVAHGDRAGERLVWRVIYILTEFELYRLGEAAEEPRLPG